MLSLAQCYSRLGCDCLGHQLANSAESPLRPGTGGDGMDSQLIGEVRCLSN